MQLQQRVAEADPLEALLEGRFRDPESGQNVGVTTKSLAIEASLAGSEADLVAGLGFGRKLAIIADPETNAALGTRVARALGGRFTVDAITLPANPEPDAETVARVRAASAGADALIAVGSGTINDLAKYASALDHKPYAVFATAPSMNGFTSLTASITVDGHKKTLPAHAPAGAFFDLKVLAAAPARLIRSGLGDSICRATAQWDWLLSHQLLGTSYRELPFALLKGDEPDLIAHAADLLGGDLEVMRRLVRTLLLSGFGTAIVGSSAPASQAEHLVSHYIDMLGPVGRPPVFHGEQIAVTTLSIARLQEAMMDGPAPILVADRATEAEFITRYGDHLGHSTWPEFAEKRLTAERADELNHDLATNWQNFVAHAHNIALPSTQILAALTAAGAPTTPEAIHLDRSFYEGALTHARDIRNRYTVLDLAAASGRLASLVPQL
jgi:glycerol-1-phosphate dehydrogenase [NAD(P)+]